MTVILSHHFAIWMKLRKIPPDQWEDHLAMGREIIISNSKAIRCGSLSSMTCVVLPTDIYQCSIMAISENNGGDGSYHDTVYSRAIEYELNEGGPLRPRLYGNIAIFRLVSPVEMVELATKNENNTFIGLGFRDSPNAI